MRRPDPVKLFAYNTIGALYGGPGMFYLLVGEWGLAAIGLGAGLFMTWLASEYE